MNNFIIYHQVIEQQRKKETKLNTIQSTQQNEKHRQTLVHIAYTPVYQMTSIINSGRNEQGSNVRKQRKLEQKVIARVILCGKCLRSIGTGNLKPNISWHSHSITVCISQVLNNLIKNRLTGKSINMRLVLVKWHTSRPYSTLK